MLCIQCDKKKICRVNNFMEQFKGEIVHDIASCIYYGGATKPNNMVAPLTILNPEEINARSQQIHALRKNTQSDMPSSSNITVE